MNAQEHRDTLPGPGSDFWKGNMTSAVRYLLEREAKREENAARPPITTPPAPTGQDEERDIAARYLSGAYRQAGFTIEHHRSIAVGLFQALAALSTPAPPEPDSIAPGTRVITAAGHAATYTKPCDATPGQCHVVDGDLHTPTVRVRYDLPSPTPPAVPDEETVEALARVVIDAAIVKRAQAQTIARAVLAAGYRKADR